ncbi:MAG: peptidoglycan -binding protein [Paracoccaceae bacterium]|nr:peptidoglycan -binding protein [Paracoccaceae bacterium]
MALIRRSGARFSANIWPGFVDAMTAILLVLMFVLSIFMIVQSILRDTITGQNSQLAVLSLQLHEIRNDLGLEKSKLAQLNARFEEKLIALSVTEEKFNVQRLRNAQLDEILKSKTSNIEALKSDFEDLTFKLQAIQSQLSSKTIELSSSQKDKDILKTKLYDLDSLASERMALLVALRTKFEMANQKVQNFEAQIAGLILRTTQLVKDLDEAENKFTDVKNENQLVKLALSKAREEVNSEAEAARLFAARADALEALVEDFKKEQESLINTNVGLTKEFENKENLILKISADLKKKDIDLKKAEADILLEQAAISNLKKKLSAEKEELGLLTLTLDAERKKAVETLQLIASSKALQKLLREKNYQLLLSKNAADEALEIKKIALLEARAQLLKQEDLIKASVLEVERLNLTSEALSKELSEMQTILDESEFKEQQKNVELKLLGSRLNAALARVASEQRKRAELEAKEVQRLKLEANDLKNYRSEFFGRLRAIIGGKEGIEIVGDRFVFASEVLFQPGSATIEDQGRKQLSAVAKVIKEVSPDIPEKINWILRVDGHTDIQPLAKASQFKDNWELSQARSLSVVKYLIKYEEVDPNRLAATGFGQFQPLEYGSNPDALARNRRIELKLTEK